MTVADSSAGLISTASIAGAVAAFYYTTQRTDLRESVAKPSPHGDEKRQSLRNELSGRRTMAAVVLLVHLPLTVLFVLGAVDAVASFDPSSDVDPTRVAVIVVAGLAVLHAWTIWSDLRSVQNRMKHL